MGIPWESALQTIMDRLERLGAIEQRLSAIESCLFATHKDHYRVHEFAVILGRSAYTVRRWVSEGKIKAIRVEGTGPRGRLLIPREQLGRLITTGMGQTLSDALGG